MKVNSSLIALFIIYLFSFQLTFTKFFSQSGQDKFIYEHFFKSKKEPGIFIEIGAYEGIVFSNTYFFEKELNWHGICIEPVPHAFEKLQKHRPGSICINGCIANRVGKVQFMSAYMLSGIIDSYDPRHLARVEHEVGEKQQIIEVQCYKLNDLLTEYNMTPVDYLSIDTEGNELEILQSIDFSTFTIEIISVENNFNEPYIRNFLQSKNYKYIARLGSDEIYQKKSQG